MRMSKIARRAATVAQINHVWRPAHRLYSARRSCVRLRRPDLRLFMAEPYAHAKAWRSRLRPCDESRIWMDASQGPGVDFGAAPSRDGGARHDVCSEQARLGRCGCCRRPRVRLNGRMARASASRRIPTAPGRILTPNRGQRDDFGDLRRDRRAYGLANATDRLPFCHPRHHARRAAWVLPCMSVPTGPFPSP
jgi:hypothetical protein